MSVKIQLFEVGAYRSDAIRFLSVGMDEKRSLQRKSNIRNELVARIMDSAALIKQERQNDLRKARHTTVKKVEKCIEVDGGIFERLL
jgi:hypothetical protein